MVKGRVVNWGKPAIGQLVKVALLAVNFFRIVIDEAHIVKNKFSNIGRAARCLKAEYRWAVTGTPMINDYEELQGIFRFLHLKPLDDEST
ncbi:hypothetical protein EJ03DRAFT_322609 [Teratosphaeria nubilosa]|uniref:SNF2 N-terminal domain-containing protein n=1 Tax=Teratosphaeria nubilosa TaxID=161662 RepID=A0A6G1KU66_9PEZI|nr:hypothetical protein EJ03DRAFT_322609 [Teratosphaeria nubilosa]